MDLEVMASVQEHIIGHCLCVLGDAMAMPIGSMIAKFKDELEAHMEKRRIEYAPAEAAPAEAAPVEAAPAEAAA